MQEHLSIINEDYDLLDQNEYLERYYDVKAKLSKIEQILNLVKIQNINYVSLEESLHQKNKVHLYFFYKPSNNRIRIGKKFFDDKLLSALRENENIKLVYFIDDETICEHEVINIYEYFKSIQINTNQIILYTNGSNIDYFISKNNLQLKHIKSSSLPINFSKKFKEIHIEFKTNKEFLFLTQNWRFKTHRFLLLSFLYEKQILHNSDWSMIENPYYENNISDYDQFDLFKDVHSIDSIKSFINFINKIKHKKNFHEDDLIIESYGQTPMIKESFLNSYINITTETNFIDYSVHITEKSFKPFYFCQIPLILASHGHIKKMKELYGYDFFDDLINHDYDEEPNHAIRLSKIFHEIERLNKNKNQIIDFYINNKDRFEKNKKITEDLQNIDESVYFYKI